VCSARTVSSSKKQPRSAHVYVVFLLKLTASKGILIWRARMVCYLYPAALPYGIVVEVDIGAFVEAMVRRLLGWWGDVIVDVGEAVLVSMFSYVLVCSTHSVNRDTSPCCGGILSE
jgi:hypothetical protein